MSMRLWVQVCCLFWSATAFPLPTHRHISRLYHSSANDDATLMDQDRARVNDRVRAILPILADLDKSSSTNTNTLGPEWTKAKRYLYHRSDLAAPQATKVVQFLENVLQGDKDLVAHVICSKPRILRFSVERYLQPMAQFLEELYGEDMFLEAVKRNPGLLLSRGVGCDAPEDSIASIESYLTESLGLKAPELESIKGKAPWLLQRSLMDIQSTVAYWEEILKHNGKSDFNNQKTLVRLLKSYPTLFNLSVDKGLAPKVDYLQEECGLSLADVASLLTGHKAAVFCLSLEDNLRPTVELLKERLLQVADDELIVQRLRKCIVAHPNILCVSRPNFMEKLSYFDQVDALCACKPETSLSSRVLLRSPTVYSLSLRDNIAPKVAFLAQVWGLRAPTATGEPAKEADQNVQKKRRSSDICLSTLLAESPSILTMSLEGNIQPTLNFYNRTGFTCLDENWKLCNAREDDDDKSAVPLVRARYIASSLFQRLLPRWHYYLMEKDRYSSLLDELKTPPLHLLAAANDKAYCEYLRVKEGDFKAFKEEAVPRLKFSSQFDTWLKTGRPIE